jgi:hypothetical protein
VLLLKKNTIPGSWLSVTFKSSSSSPSPSSSSSGATVHSQPWPLHDCSPFIPILCLSSQFLTPIIFRSSPIESSHQIADLPTRRIPSGLWRVHFLQAFCSCILKMCPSHLNLLNFITFIICCSLHNRCNS